MCCRRQMFFFPFFSVFIISFQNNRILYFRKIYILWLSIQCNLGKRLSERQTHRHRSRDARVDCGGDGEGGGRGGGGGGGCGDRLGQVDQSLRFSHRLGYLATIIY